MDCVRFFSMPFSSSPRVAEGDRGRPASGPVRPRRRFLRRGLVLVSLALATACGGQPAGERESAAAAEAGARERARRHTNRGVAYLAQFLPGKAIEEFQAALALDGDNLAATVDLGIAYRVSADLESSRSWLERALRLEPDNVIARYNMALVERLSGNAAAALAHLERVAELDPTDAETRYVLGLTRAQLQQYEQAAEEFDRALALNPTHASAFYGKGRALMALGREEEALAAIQRSQELSGGQLATTSGQQYGEQGRYSLAIEDMPHDPEAGAPVPVRFEEIGASSGVTVSHAGGPRDEDGRVVGSGAALADLDGDGDLDLYMANAGREGGAPNRLYRNRGDGTFQDVTTESGAGDPGQGTGVAVGDFDNDGFVDLYVGNWGLNRLYRNRGDGTFEDVTGRAGVGDPGRALGVAFGDADHDGDLDLIVANRDPDGGLVFYRNRGDGTFDEATDPAGFGGQSPATGLLFLDADGDRDIDLVVTGPGPVRLFLNNRDGTFTDSASRWGLVDAAGRRGVASLDLHKDGRFDLVFTGASPGASVWVQARGGRFDRQSSGPGGGPAFGIAVLDHDLDGFADVALAGASGEPGIRLFRNLGQGRLAEVTADVGLAGIAGGDGRGLLAGDLDGDGDPDLVLTRAGAVPLLFRNAGAPRRAWLAVSLEGLHSNRSGIGSRVAVRAGALWQHASLSAGGGYLTAGPLRSVFGLADGNEVDAVSVLWPGGILQDELDPRTGEVLRVKELDRKGSSCPTLFGWNGRRFAYLSDFIGGGVLGLVLAPGVVYQPDPEELHLVRPEVGLAPDAGGRIALRLTDNLEEVTYVDRVGLRSVDHPVGTVILPREGLRPVPPYPAPTLHLMEAILPPLEARDGGGHDWLAAIQAIDRSYPTFPLRRRLGHAEPHTLTVTFPAPPAGRRVWLWAHGTLEFSNSTPNFAAAQDGKGLAWPVLEVGLPGGGFRILEAAMPVPMGVDKPALVDLTGTLPPGPVTLRIRTSLEIYWDRLALALEGDAASMQVKEWMPSRAELRPGGFPLWVSEDGRLPKTFRYAAARSLDTWKRIPGHYTRHGPVEELVRRSDDLLVVMSPGDELALEFDVSQLPPPGPGRMRTWLVHGVGYVKDMDLHSPAAGQVDPLPFATMGSFPPDAAAYFADPARAETALRYNTRMVLPGDPLRRWPVGSAIDAPGGRR